MLQHEKLIFSWTTAAGFSSNGDDDFLKDLDILTNNKAGKNPPLSQQTSAAVNNKSGISKSIAVKKGDDDDDDLMSFLQDDSNF